MSVSLFGLPETDCHNCSAIDKQIRLTVATRSDKENCTACSTKAIQSRPKELLELLLILQNNVKMRIFRKPCTCLHQFQGRSDSAGALVQNLPGVSVLIDLIQNIVCMYFIKQRKRINSLDFMLVKSSIVFDKQYTSSSLFSLCFIVECWYCQSIESFLPITYKVERYYRGLRKPDIRHTR